VTPPLNLCANCLHPGATGVDVGPEKGSQRDPYRESLPLCPPCAEALLTGDLATLSENYSAERTIRRGT